MLDPVTAQIAINSMIDVIWPMLPPHVLTQLAYV